MQEHLDEDMLQALLGDIGDGIVLTDREEKVLYLNRAAKRILSYQGKVGGDLYFDEVCPLVNLKTRKAFDSPLQIAMRERRSLGLARNIGICTMEGSMYLSATCSPIYGKDGEVQGCSVLLRDVTHLRKLEMKLEANHIYMRSVFEAAKTGLCVLSSDGAIMDLNDAAIEIMESSYKEIIGLQFGDAFHCENSILKGCGHGSKCRHCPVRNNLEAAIMDDDFTGEFTVALRSKKKSVPVWMKMFISQTIMGDEKQIIMSMVDVSKRKQRERAMEQARFEAEQASRAKGQFLANMSHELRTPLNGIMGMLKLVMATELTPKQRENLMNAKHSAEDLLHVVHDIMNFSKLESGQLQLEERGLDLHLLVRNVVQSYGHAAKKRGILFSMPDFKHVPRYIKGDALRLRQVFRNLLMNSLKFTSSGSILMQACKEVQNDGEVLCFSIHDTGVGMPWGTEQELFRPFRQEDGISSWRYGGIGLGLMIVRDLVRAMRGDIRVHAIPGRGSSITFWIPYLPADGVEPVKRKRSIFLNPRIARGQSAVAPEAERSEADGDITNLLDYCQRRMRGEERS